MHQYLFAAYTISVPADADLNDETVCNSWAETLTSLAIGEMFHAVAVANLITANGSTPDFHLLDAAFIRQNDRGKWVESGAPFALTPFNSQTLRRLLIYELEDSAPVPKPNLLPASFLSLLGMGTVAPSIGKLYRAIDDFLKMDGERYAKLDRARLLTGECIRASQSTSRIAEDMIVDSPSNMPGDWRDVVWRVIIEGEGGLDSDTPDGPLSHVEMLCGLISSMTANRQLLRRVVEKQFLVNPTIHDTLNEIGISRIDSPQAMSLAQASSAAYKLLIDMLCALWTEQANPKAKTSLFGLSTGAMNSIFGAIARCIADLRASSSEHFDCYAAPTFEFPIGANFKNGEGWSTQLTQVSDSCVQLIELLDGAQSELRKDAQSNRLVSRIGNAIETTRILKSSIDFLKKEYP